MNRHEEIKKAIFNMGGLKIAASTLNVTPGAISKWVRNGVIPNLHKAEHVANASGFDLASLRPRYEQKANI
ncbi:hypothetical protein [Eoetvoesiella caeni]|uniref:YdaS antitoxin of YdaST toxin-antitoxin system n=1 Tax=Eoetvoesiella caeni TaxID=645616 RepID=A0A366H4M2_9BURK|nr:hypothetical protein [Eoetvoesiella caeni]MCI2810408.1 helix-turn-helix domain-containing protein [Eoetvoesiella caeni]NYT54920.1 hypothetical protein [Eoetvoesiella caeni]RBP36835.1 hypothetical protein DFR37_111143 [Eoetvoesiella caeni]